MWFSELIKYFFDFLRDVFNDVVVVFILALIAIAVCSMYYFEHEAHDIVNSVVSGLLGAMTMKKVEQIKNGNGGTK